MSFLKHRPKRPTLNYLDVRGKKGLPDGEHYFVLGAGNLAEGEASFTNQSLEMIPQEMCQFYMQEFGEDGGYVRWLYTGPEDPIHELGLDNKNQSSTRLKELYADKAPKYPQRLPEVKYIIPVAKVEKAGKTFNTADATYFLLIVTESDFNNIVEAAKAFEMQENSGVYGRILFVRKDLSRDNPQDKYNFSFLMMDPLHNDSMVEEFSNLYAQAMERLENIFNESNGGEYSGENAWKYLMSHFGGTRDQLIKKYCVKPVLNLQETESVKI